MAANASNSLLMRLTGEFANVSFRLKTSWQAGSILQGVPGKGPGDLTYREKQLVRLIRSMGIPALYLKLYAQSSSIHLLLSKAHAFVILLCPLFFYFFFDSFVSDIFSCLSSKHHQSRKYLRFIRPPQVIHCSWMFLCPDWRFCHALYCLAASKSHEKIAADRLTNCPAPACHLGTVPCRDQVFSPCQTPTETHPAWGDDGGPSHPANCSVAKYSSCGAREWLRLFSLPDWLEFKPQTKVWRCSLGLLLFCART